MQIYIYTDNSEKQARMTKVIKEAVPGAAVRQAHALDTLPGTDADTNCMVFVDAESASEQTIPLTKRIKDIAPKAYTVIAAKDGRFAADAYRIHVDGYIEGRADAARIRDEYDHCLRVKGKAPETAARPGRISIRKGDRFEVYLDGRPVTFDRNKTRDLLAILVENSGTLVSNEEIIEKLWGKPTASRKSNLRNIKVELVKLFEEAGQADALVTCRGRICLMPDKVNIIEKIGQ